MEPTSIPSAAAAVTSPIVSSLERKYGRNALPNLFDAKAKAAKESAVPAYAYVMRTPHVADGFDEVTYPMIANAVNRASWWLVNEVGLAEGDVFAYMGPSDLRYLVLLLASAKTGRKIMLPSLRNTISAQKILFERTNTGIILFGDEMQKNLQPLFDALPDMKTRKAPSFHELFDSNEVPHYEAREIPDERLHEPMFLVHTSGSSGNPKPIGQSAAYWLAVYSFQDVPQDGGDIHNCEYLVNGDKMLHFFPPFHLGGLFFYTVAAIQDSTLICSHPAAAITAEHVINILDQGIATGFAAADSILTDLSKSERGLQALSKLDKIIYGGGPLSAQTGKIIAPRAKNLLSAIGMTENGLFHCVALRGTKFWDCIKFNTRVGYRFDEVSPGIYELVVSLAPEYRRFHPVTYVFPDIEEYRTNDLYTRVPDAENCYRYQGRRDDLIVLSNGEKINPIPMEEIVASHPAVRSALFVGERRFLPSLLIELRDSQAVKTEDDSRRMVDQLWGIISKANSQAPRFSRVPKSLVYILRPTETFERSGKMTVQRQLTVVKFAAQIESLYESAGEGLLSEGLELEDASNPDSIKSVARALYVQLLDIDEDSTRLCNDDNIFELGMDSLQVAVAVQRLRAVLRMQTMQIDVSKIGPHFFYASPTVNSLSRAIEGLFKGLDNATDVGESTDRKDKIQALINKYSTGLDVQLAHKKIRKDGLTVLLTGSTGSLGSYILHTLVENARVAKIICLNRSDDAQSRQTAGNKRRGLSTPWETSDQSSSSNRVEFLTADLSQSDLGLGRERYDLLLESIDAIIHNAWKVDFNHTIETFEKGHIAGTRHLIDLSRGATHQAPVLFISSISTALNWIHKHPDQRIPESIIYDLDSPEFLGYGESKYVSERLVEAHSLSSGFSSAVFRVGQIAGPVLSTAGVWNVHEWFPSMLASSKYLGLLPESMGTMDGLDWVPVDILTRIIVQLLHQTHEVSSGSDAVKVYNLVNPHCVPSASLLSTVSTGLAGGKKDAIKIVPLEDWVEVLDKSTQENHGFVNENNPATKLLGFWRGVSGRSIERPAKSHGSSLIIGHTNGTLKQSNGVPTTGSDHERSEEMKALSKASHVVDRAVEGKFEVAKLLRDSSEAAGLQPVSPEWMKIWLRQWNF